MATNIIQIYSVVNSIAQQVLGMTGLTATNTSFVSVGNEVLSSSANVDSFYGELIQRIGRTVVSMREYDGIAGRMRRESMEWGMILQKLYIDLPVARANDVWDSQTAEVNNPFEVFPTEVKQKLFAKMAVWDVDQTIKRDALRIAFNSAESMGALISGILMSMDTSLRMSFDNTAVLCRANFIALKAKANNPNTYVNLLGGYNTETNKTLTISSCMSDADFWRYSAMIIKLYTDRMTVLSSIFNEEGFKRHTPKDMQILTVHSDVDSRMKFYLQSNTYHSDLVALTMYDTVPFWQGSGTSFAWADTSSVKVMTDGSTETTVNNVVALLTDYEALGVTMKNEKIESIYNPRNGALNYFAHADIGYMNDLSENGVVFYLAEA